MASRVAIQPVVAYPAELVDDVPLADLIEEYRAALRVAGRSPRTIRWYVDHLAEFVRFLEREGNIATLAELRAASVRRWLIAVQAGHERPLAPSSLAGRVRTVHAFGSWMAREFGLDHSPVRGVPVPRVPERIIPSLRDGDIRALVRAVEEGSTQPDRDRAIVLLLLDTGVRLSEAAGLRVRDVDLIEGRCRVMGKGSRERVVPIGRRTRQALRRSLARRGTVDADDALFVGPDRQPLAAHAYQQLFRRLVRRSKLSVRCSPHVLRHTFARSFLQNGGDVFSLQRILGHSPTSLQVTRRYVDLLDDDLRAIHRQASPVDRLD
jgi:site-specific recombinase XerD